MTIKREDRPKRQVHVNALEFRSKLHELEEMYLDHIKDAMQHGFDACKALSEDLRNEIAMRDSKISGLERRIEVLENNRP